MISLDEKLLDFIVIDKVNIKVALLQANKGIPESIQLVKDIVKNILIWEKSFILFLAVASLWKKCWRCDDE